MKDSESEKMNGEVEIALGRKKNRKSVKDNCLNMILNILLKV
jgi:hypothetical protein